MSTKYLDTFNNDEYYHLCPDNEASDLNEPYIKLFTLKDKPELERDDFDTDEEYEQQLELLMDEWEEDKFDSELINHKLDFFASEPVTHIDWGYDSPMTDQCAFVILYHFTEDENIAKKYFKPFANEFLLLIERGECFKILASDVARFINEMEEL